MEITIYTYEAEKLFQDGDKKNDFTRSDIIWMNTNFTFGDNLSILFNKW